MPHPTYTPPVRQRQPVSTAGAALRALGDALPAARLQRPPARPSRPVLLYGLDRPQVLPQRWVGALL